MWVSGVPQEFSEEDIYNGMFILKGKPNSQVEIQKLIQTRWVILALFLTHLLSNA
jgi:hypothetical protein